MILIGASSVVSLPVSESRNRLFSSPCTLTLFMSLMLKYVCSAEVMVNGSLPVFFVVSSMVNLSLIVTVSVAINLCGHICMVSSVLCNLSVIFVVPSSTACVESTDHSNSRAKPCAFFVVSVGCAPNHGQHSGIPPRMGLPGLRKHLLLTHSTSLPLRGLNDSTCAPYRLIFAVAVVLVIYTY